MFFLLRLLHPLHKLPHRGNHRDEQHVQLRQAQDAFEIDGHEAQLAEGDDHQREAAHQAHPLRLLLQDEQPGLFLAENVAVRQHSDEADEEPAEPVVVRHTEEGAAVRLQMVAFFPYTFQEMKPHMRKNPTHTGMTAYGRILGIISNISFTFHLFEVTSHIIIERPQSNQKTQQEAFLFRV